MKKIKDKVYAEARIAVRNKIIELQNIDPNSLTEEDEVKLESILQKKSNLIREVAEKKFNTLLEKLNNDFKDKFKTPSKRKKVIQQYNRFDEEVDNNSTVYQALCKKSNTSGIDLETLGEVYNRGWNCWKESFPVSQQQYAFARVNSFINQGNTYFTEDADLVESKNKQYVKKHYGDPKHPDHQTAWKANNKHGKVKYFGIDFKASAIRHAGLTEELTPEYIQRMHDVSKRFPGGTYLHTTAEHKGEHGSGYVTGPDPKKKDHVILTVPSGWQGVRSKNQDEYKDISVHKNHLTTEYKKSAAANPKLHEGRMNQLGQDMKELDNGNFKKKYKNDKDHFRKELNVPVKEEVEDISELSKELLARYVKKADNSIDKMLDKSLKHYDYADQHRKRIGSYSSDKYHPIEVKNREEMLKHVETARKIGVKTDKRMRFANKAETKVNEEFLDEAITHEKIDSMPPKQRQNLFLNVRKHFKDAKSAGKDPSPEAQALHTEFGKWMEKNPNKLHTLKPAVEKIMKSDHPDKYAELQKRRSDAKLTRAFSQFRKAMKEEIDFTKPENREVGTDSLTKIYKEMTPGQDEVQEAVKRAGMVPVVVPSYIDVHGNVIPAKTVMRKTGRLILRTGNVHDGKN